MSRHEHIYIGNSEDDFSQMWSTYDDKTFYLNSYYRAKLKSGKLSKKFTEIRPSYSPFYYCGICGFFGISRRFIYAGIYGKKNGIEFDLYGCFCRRCSCQVEALKNCCELITEMKKEIKNAKQNTNGRTIKNISVQHDSRY